MLRTGTINPNMKARKRNAEVIIFEEKKFVASLSRKTMEWVSEVEVMGEGEVVHESMRPMLTNARVLWIVLIMRSLPLRSAILECVSVVGFDLYFLVFGLLACFEVG